MVLLTINDRWHDESPYASCVFASTDDPIYKRLKARAEKAGYRTFTNTLQSADQAHKFLDMAGSENMS